MISGYGLHKAPSGIDAQAALLPIREGFFVHSCNDTLDSWEGLSEVSNCIAITFERKIETKLWS